MNGAKHLLPWRASQPPFWVILYFINSQSVPTDFLQCTFLEETRMSLTFSSYFSSAMLFYCVYIIFKSLARWKERATKTLHEEETLKNFFWGDWRIFTSQFWQCFATFLMYTRVGCSITQVNKNGKLTYVIFVLQYNILFNNRMAPKGLRNRTYEAKSMGWD